LHVDYRTDDLFDFANFSHKYILEEVCFEAAKVRVRGEKSSNKKTNSEAVDKPFLAQLLSLDWTSLATHSLR
jgi:hypothetical protein